MPEPILYKKVDEEFVPCGVMLPDYLPDGIWLVNSGEGFRGKTSLSYLLQLMPKTERTKFNLKEVADIDITSDELLKEFYKSHSTYYSMKELTMFILSKIYEPIRQRQKRIK